MLKAAISTHSKKDNNPQRPKPAIETTSHWNISTKTSLLEIEENPELDPRCLYDSLVLDTLKTIGSPSKSSILGVSSDYHSEED